MLLLLAALLGCGECLLAWKAAGGLLQRSHGKAEALQCTAAGHSPKVIRPSRGTNSIAIEKFLMMYTCKLCKGRNAQMVSKVAYNHGMVISTCRHCKQNHLIADNERKLDMGADYGKKIEDYLVSQGQVVQRLSITEKELQENFLVDNDGVLKLVPRHSGQVRRGEERLCEIHLPRNSTHPFISDSVCFFSSVF